MATKAPSVIMLIFLTLAAETITARNAANEVDYNGFLTTETAIIETLRKYITKVEEKLTIIKCKTNEIKTTHEEALDDVEKYVSNPYNALAILKRFATDWHALHKMASSVLNSSDEISKDISVAKESLKFPSEDDFDEAVGNLLRLQDIYKLEPKRLSLGEIDGIKFGTEMSWSDCLEIGRKSDEQGEYTIAKFWIEAAMEKLPKVNKSMITETRTNSTESNETAKARFEILQALLNAEFHMDNFEEALTIVDEMLSLKPEHKGVLKAKATIEKTLKKETKKAKNKRLKKSQKALNKRRENKKSAETALIEEMCRDSTMLAPHRASEAIKSSYKSKCYLESGNLKGLLLQPTKIETLSLDPYVVIQHGVLSEKQVDDLKSLIDEIHYDAVYDDDAEHDIDIDDEPPRYEFTNLAKQKLRRLNNKLELHTGHLSVRFDAWQPQWHSFENEALLLSETDTAATLTTMKQRNIIANVMLSLESAKLGGSLVFPQLELSVKLPRGALLYWSNLDEFQEIDYRIKNYVCPVISGSQISAVNTIRRI